MADWIMVELPGCASGSGHGDILRDRIEQVIRDYQRDGAPEAVMYARGPFGWSPTLLDGGATDLSEAAAKLHAADRVAQAARALAEAHLEYRQAAQAVEDRRAREAGVDG